MHGDSLTLISVSRCGETAPTLGLVGFVSGMCHRALHDVVAGAPLELVSDQSVAVEKS